MDDTRDAFLKSNSIAIGGVGDPEEFRREYERFRSLLPGRTPLRVLDIGCGTGAWSVHWVALGARVTGVDIDADLLERARARPELPAAQFETHVADAGAIPLPEKSFDVVTLNSLLEHVPDWQPVLREAARMTAPGGLLVLHTTNRMHPFQGEVNGFHFYPWLPEWLKRPILAWIMKHRRDLVNYTDYPAVHWFTYRQLRGELEALGFEAFDRLDLMKKSQLGGVRRLASWMLTDEGKPARGKFLYNFVSGTVSLYARRR